jgi:hypothetical protein
MEVSRRLRVDPLAATSALGRALNGPAYSARTDSALQGLMLVTEGGVLRLQFGEFRIGLIFGSDEPIVRRRHRSDELIELEMNGQSIAILGVLDQEDHEEGHNRGAGIDHQLPGVREAEEWSAYTPNEDDH